MTFDDDSLATGAFVGFLAAGSVVFWTFDEAAIPFEDVVFLGAAFLAVSLATGFCADFDLVIPSTDFLELEWVGGADALEFKALSADLGEVLVADFDLAEDLGEEFCPVFWDVEFPVPFAAGLLAESLELADFLRSVDNLVAPGNRWRKQAKLEAVGPHPFTLS